MNLAQSVSVWDLQIRSGEGRHVVELIAALDASLIPIELKPKVAALARRLGLYAKGFEFLKESYLTGRNASDSKNQAVAIEYAALLTEVGATKIASKVMARYPDSEYAFYSFYRALLKIKNWDYQGASEDLDFFKTKMSDVYWLNVADLNLLACEIFLHDFEKAEKLHLDISARIDSFSPLLTGVFRELTGQLLFFSNRRIEAKAHFANSLADLKKAHNPNALFAEKWVVICDLFEKPWAEVGERFSAFRKRAEDLGFWEVIRELDRFYAVRFSNEQILAKLFFGSPAPGYRNMLMRDSKWNPPEFFDFHLGLGEPTGILDLDLLDWHSKKSESLLRALSSDLYRPLAVGSLFEAVYENEYFEPSFAGLRINQMIWRFRSLMKKQRLPLKIESRDFGFVLGADTAFGIRYWRKSLIDPSRDARPRELLKIEECFGTGLFKAASLAKALDISPRTTNRVLKSLHQDDYISKIGSGPGTHYKLKIKI